MTTRRSSLRNHLTAASAVAFALVLAGCNTKAKPTEANFSQTINTYYTSHPECLFTGVRFPYATSDPTETKQMNTLVKSQLLEATYETAIKTTRFTIGRAGQRYAPRFCYGHRTVTAITSSTAPAKGATGFPESHIVYSYKLEDVPIWAQTAEVQAAYPKMATAITSGGTGEMNLAQTLAGWQVPE
ncbi:MAG: hypothetical protein PW789_05750 [Edaphobacter sp.]|uniref:hypothetical protein n=1 Tax=Edaphobacter sp. TaxID=1934404 RepID=UPI00239C2E90|nr:hypothetical protein [Edaphobacter sp.]MDE1176095.1 hypothetical protein [Edaphobacter sp.]